MNKEKLNKLLKLDVSEYTQEKMNLTYLSWANAWKEFLKVYPNAKYKVIKDENGQCWFGNNENGYMVYTEVTAEDTTHQMWLPVMNYKNNAIKKPTTFDINKAVMRCLTKNLAMFGLGLYIYAGEDLPEFEPLDQNKIKALYTKANKKGLSNKDVKKGIKRHYGATSTKQLTLDDFKDMMDRLDKLENKKDNKKGKND